jgi:glyoxylase-like metal-dependent hydrolase (beta-lactamase superfamily II)
MSTFDRRGFIRTGTAAALSGAGGLALLGEPLAASPAAAPPPRPPAAAPGFYRFSLGDFRITVLSDGYFGLPAESFGTNVTEPERSAYYQSRLLPLDAISLPANPVVVHTGSRLVLVDAGTGATGEPPPSTGRLSASLAAAGIRPDAIDAVILTHAHGDHVGGLLDAATGTLRFRNAEVVLSDTEHALWSAADVARRIPGWAADMGMIDANRAIFAALGDRLRTVAMEGEVTAGIRSVATPGHTPGHIGLLVASGGEQMLMVGDAIANPHTHVERPDWQMRWDHDPEQGVRTRRRLLDRIATERLLVQGFHLPFPGVGHAVRDGRAYRWLATA